MRSDEDCRDSAVCDQLGRCRARGGECVAASDSQEYSESGFGGYRFDRDRRRRLYRDMTHLERVFVCREVGEPFDECRRE